MISKDTLQASRLLAFHSKVAAAKALNASREKNVPGFRKYSLAVNGYAELDNTILMGFDEDDDIVCNWDHWEPSSAAQSTFT